MTAKGYYLLNNCCSRRNKEVCYKPDWAGQNIFFATVPLFQQTYGGGSAFRFRFRLEILTYLSVFQILKNTYIQFNISNNNNCLI